MLDRLAALSSPFLERLSPETMKVVAAASIPVKYTDGGLIHNRGDEKPGLSIVRSGSVRVGIIRPDGTFVITSILGPGQNFGEFTIFAGLPRTHDIIAQGETEIWQLPAERFHRLSDVMPDITQAILAITLVRNYVLLELVEAMRSLPVKERVAKTLFMLVTLAGRETRFYTRQSDLAATLGLSRTTLSKALSQLENEGLVSRGYGVIRLPDRERLFHWITARDI